MAIVEPDPRDLYLSIAKMSLKTIKDSKGDFEEQGFKGVKAIKLYAKRALEVIEFTENQIKEKSKNKNENNFNK